MLPMGKLYLLLLILLIPLTALKAVDYKLSPLQEMASSLQELGPLIREAQRNTDRAERFRFEYKDLISDLAIIHNGLVSAATGKEERNHQIRSLLLEYGYVGRTAEARYLTMLKQELQRLKNRALSLVPVNEGAEPTRKTNYHHIAADFSSVIDAITVAIAGAGDRPRRFLALDGDTL